jgi:hypothetical protein
MTGILSQLAGYKLFKKHHAATFPKKRGRYLIIIYCCSKTGIPAAVADGWMFKVTLFSSLLFSSLLCLYPVNIIYKK